MLSVFISKFKSPSFSFFCLFISGISNPSASPSFVVVVSVVVVSVSLSCVSSWGCASWGCVSCCRSFSFNIRLYYASCSPLAFFNFCSCSPCLRCVCCSSFSAGSSSSVASSSSKIGVVSSGGSNSCF